MVNPIRHILYSLNEGNSNNPANLLVGEDITIINSKTDDSFLGVIELIDNSQVVVVNKHTDESYNFTFNGFNAHENGIEFINDDDPDLRFYIY